MLERGNTVEADAVRKLSLMGNEKVGGSIGASLKKKSGWTRLQDHAFAGDWSSRTGEHLPT